MMFTRARRAKAADFDFAGGVNRSTSAVPSQLLPTKTTGVVVAALAASFAAGAEAARAPIAQDASTAVAAATIRRFFDLAVPLRLRTIQPPVGDERTVTKPSGVRAGSYHSRGFPAGIRSITRVASTRSTGYGVVAR